MTTRARKFRQVRAKVAGTTKTAAAGMTGELAALAARYGFGSVADFFAAVTKALGRRGLRKPVKVPARFTLGGKEKGGPGSVMPYLTPAERSRRTIAGMKAARRRGTRFGRPPLDPKIVRRIHAAAARMGHRVRAIARKIHVPPSTVCRVLAKGR